MRALAALLVSALLLAPVVEARRDHAEGHALQPPGEARLRVLLAAREIAAAPAVA